MEKHYTLRIQMAIHLYMRIYKNFHQLLSSILKDNNTKKSNLKLSYSLNQVLWKLMQMKW